MVGSGACAAREADFLLAQIDVGQIARQFPARAPQVDLKCEGVFAWSSIQNPLQWRIGNEAAIPIEFAVDLSGGKSWRERAAGHHMRWSDLVCGVVEIDEVPGCDIHGTDAEASGARIDAIEINQVLQHSFEWSHIVEAQV